MKELVKVISGKPSSNKLYTRPLIEFLCFGLKQLVGISFGLCLVIGFLFTVGNDYRYDILFIYALVIQVLLYKVGFESKRDILVVTICYLIGLSMELIEVSINHSWAYTCNDIFYIASVPIFTGFMYASVGSYMAKEFKLLKLKVENAFD